MCQVWSRSVKQSRLPIWVKLSATGIFFFLIFVTLARAQPTPGARPPHIIHQSMQFDARMYLLGVSTQNFFIWESYFPKTPSFWGGLNVESNNFRTARPILVICSSNDAAPRKEFGCPGQAAKMCFLGKLLIKIKLLQREFTSQNPPFCNFLKIQPIHTNSWCSSASSTWHKVKTPKKFQS
jgi:hypothetical protein